jgi:hypothetical protein
MGRAVIETAVRLVVLFGSSPSTGSLAVGDEVVVAEARRPLSFFERQLESSRDAVESAR